LLPGQGLDLISSSLQAIQAKPKKSTTTEQECDPLPFRLLGYPAQGKKSPTTKSLLSTSPHGTKREAMTVKQREVMPLAQVNRARKPDDFQICRPRSFLQLPHPSPVPDLDMGGADYSK
jgi:hypothetical protein